MNEFWWKKSVVYQIYPKSFKDTTGNGTGDLQGIIEKLDYIKNLGVDVIWITPIYESPQKDNGYDISDYYKIDPQYGSIDTFERLLTQAHARGLKIILDMVVNHTSIDHAWFKKSSQSKDSPYRDFYIWKDGKDNMYPNNWKSKFGGSAWEYDENSKQYYLHLFDVTQADLNWENQELRKSIYDMMEFWLSKGVDGFRLDVINLLSKDQAFPNDTLNTPIEDGRKFYTDGPKIHTFLKKLNENVFSKYKNILTVGEMSSTSIDNCVKYTNPNEKELNMSFSFHHLKVDYPSGEKWELGKFDFIKLKKILTEWQYGMIKGNGWNALFWCNHDQPRVVSRFGNDKEYHDESAKMLATTLHLLQGTPYIYQGEEIGMTNPNFDKLQDYRDVESLNIYDILKAKGKSDKEIMDILKQKSRDNSRTPMQWDTSKNAGFTEGTPWINVSNNFSYINASSALKNKNSIFYYYKKLIRLRKDYDIIAYGDFEIILDNDPQIFAYIRRYNNEKLLVVNNFYAEFATFVLPSDVILEGESKILISNYADTKNNINELLLRPYESSVFYIK
ncbi:alpha,alpha-phosphotrehalase [Clostridium psychrophilum]|uniref:alpha,alpha-phosphotrehalase n=1 Tax=Clostridium psychrophilum TaxID=132926 RepID=UPI001C0D2C65|nr:alpha,alpha-phosphotrehalase [Clostridium psychrophilum]MBU3182404.1 alpha,alpha-phosphotrehalase [Clostridium psychrophilum]